MKTAISDAKVCFGFKRAEWFVPDANSKTGKSFTIPLSAPVLACFEALQPLTAAASWTREPEREYIDRESHYVWGQRYLLQIQELDAPASIALSGKKMRMTARPGTPAAKRQALLDAWYRAQVREAAQPLLRKWQTIMGVQAGKLLVQRMKTKWGSCNPKTGLIRLNTDLTKKPP